MALALPTGVISHGFQDDVMIGGNMLISAPIKDFAVMVGERRLGLRSVRIFKLEEGELTDLDLLKMFRLVCPEY